MDPQIAFENVVKLLTDTTFIPFAVGLVVVLTQVIKRLFPERTSGHEPLIALTFQTLIWVGYALAKSAGAGETFENWVKAVETVITALSSVLFPALLSSGVSTALYHDLKNRNVPGFGSKQDE